MTLTPFRFMSIGTTYSISKTKEWFETPSTITDKTIDEIGHSLQTTLRPIKNLNITFVQTQNTFKEKNVSVSDTVRQNKGAVSKITSTYTPVRTRFLNSSMDVLSKSILIPFHPLSYNK